MNLQHYVNVILILLYQSYLNTATVLPFVNICLVFEQVTRILHNKETLLYNYNIVLYWYIESKLE